MNHLLPCRSCHRHVRAADAARGASCPFCGVTLSRELVADRAPPAPRWRLDRVALTTVAATMGLAAACDPLLDTSVAPAYGLPCLDGDGGNRCDVSVVDGGGDARVAADAMIADVRMETSLEASVEDAADGGDADGDAAAHDASDAPAD